ncbi:MAG TPA: hypothetical protein VF469_14610 [Kofleriaceae bacterium]
MYLSVGHAQVTAIELAADASLVLVDTITAGRVARIERPVPGAPVIVAGSPLASGAVFRIAGERVDRVTGAVRALIGEACAQLGAVPWQRRW